jgi:hypothetical protein
MAEYGSSGIWVIEPSGPFRHGMIEHRRLGLPKDLAARFEAWIESYWRILDKSVPFDKPAFVAEGRELARALKRFVGADVRVVYASEDDVRRDEVISE